MAAGTMELTGDLRAGDAERLRGDLITALSGGDVALSTGGLTSVDMAVLQVLLAARRTAAQQGRHLSIDAPPGGALAAMATRLALHDALLP